MTTMPGSLGCVLQVKALLTGRCVDRGFERWVDYSVRTESGFQLEIRTESSMRCDTGCLGIVGTGSDDEKPSRLVMESSALQPLKERIVGGVAQNARSQASQGTATWKIPGLTEMWMFYLTSLE
ncbi:hypothetical protein Vi05172_g11287 [Venturia inaequalis]|nr:hypothetical protein Vi05172_g11287 [Venturia inaequalis]